MPDQASEAQPAATAAPETPARGRVFAATLRGQPFQIRRPSRQDWAEIRRRYARKLVGSGLPLETDLLAESDGGHLWWEAAFEVCLDGIVTRVGTKLDFGEMAPTHWYAADSTGGAKIVAFHNVDEEEFEEAIELCETEGVFKKKAPSPPTSSGAIAGEPKNG